MVVELLHADRRTDGRDKTNSLFRNLRKPLKIELGFVEFNFLVPNGIMVIKVGGSFLQIEATTLDMSEIRPNLRI
jgi:hypothetical protein